ncbi:MAG: VWA domain-containing protein [Candidatus Cloacimonadota bacterium]|nr:VWA domain-containing protein [Candidatus Cloacimonadota bacterium]
MHFGNPEFFIALILIPLIFFGLYFSRRKKRKLLETFASTEMQEKLILNRSTIAETITNFLLIVIIILLIIAAARPQWGKKLQIIEEKSLDIVVATDVSSSMLAEDLKPNRIQRAKNAFSSFIDQLQGDRVGLVIFSGDAFVQCPLTNDYSALKMFASIVDVGIIPKEGTNLPEAIQTSISLFPEYAKNKVLILITDGENLQGNIEQEIKVAKSENVIIYTIGVGTQNGAPIPIRNAQTGEKSYVKDADGNIVLSQLDATTLSKIARETHGGFFQVSAGEGEIRQIFNEINLMEKEKLAQHRYTRYKEQYKYFVFLAFALFIIMQMIFLRKIGLKG